ncbi:MAG: YebF family protein [Candidatus Phlomobacter fragariae]
MAKFISCDNLSQRQISAKVKNDFIQTGLPYWNEYKKILGSKVVI